MSAPGENEQAAQWRRTRGINARDGGRPQLSPAERSLRARIAAYALHASHDPRRTTQPARDAFLARFERQVDPDAILPAAERRRRAEAAKKAYFSRLALKSARARRARRSAGSTGGRSG